MIQIEDKLISEDIFSEEFVCNLSKCKGACCVAGDVGAPLEKHETEIEIHKNYLKPHSFAIHYWEVSWVKKGFIYWIKKIIKICIFYKYWK